jgi:SHS2 domain-containing protein
MYRFLEHTAELGLEVEAANLEELLEDAALAFAELVAPGASGARSRRSIELALIDDETLLADWLNELLFLAESGGFVPQSVERCGWAPGRLTADVTGFVGTPRPVIKAVTYHDLELVEDENGAWKGRVILDV